MKRTNFLNRHLVETGENYFEHLLFAFLISMWLFVTSIILFCHSILPCSFTFTASNNIKKINEVLQKRAQKLLDKRNSKIME
ncbi:MAG: hypothetical protein KGQ36_06010 [Rickettsiales bacterium]|nr:hypothetical protein [Rickettsiales bacterium]